MDRETVLRKVRACLQLAKSANVDEAATALRQAQKLMEQYGLAADDVATFEVNDARARTRSRGGEPPQSLLALASVIAGGFRCRAVLDASPSRGSTSMIFVGVGADPEIAAYAFDVMRRQLDRDKAHHVRRVRKAVVKAHRAEIFARAWVAAIRVRFPAALLPEGRDNQLARMIQRNFGETAKCTGRALKGRGGNDADRVAGFIAGSRAELRDGIAGSAPALLTGEGHGSRG